MDSSALHHGEPHAEPLDLQPEEPGGEGGFGETHRNGKDVGDVLSFFIKYGWSSWGLLPVALPEV